MVEEEKGSSITGSDESIVQEHERPKGLKGLYYHPITQVVMLGLVCFMGPGKMPPSSMLITR